MVSWSTPARSSSASGGAPTSTPGDGVGRGGSDDTLFALREGHVEFGTRRGRNVINIKPVEVAAAQ